MGNTDFKNKVITVTGAASGIGAALCEKFAQNGAKIGLLDMDEKGVKESEASFTRRGIDAIGIKCDVTREDDCNHGINKIIDHFGGIDVLVNNAGITQRSLFTDTEISVFRKVMDVNFFGSLNCTKAAVDSIIKRKGMIIVTSSIAGMAPLLGRTGYSASKHALHGLFASLRAEIKGFGAHVMIVCPGFIYTNLQQRALGGDGQVTDRPQSITGRPDTPENAADEIYKGALKRKNLLVLTPVGRLGYYINRFAPALYERIMTKKFASELLK